MNNILRKRRGDSFQKRLKIALLLILFVSPFPHSFFVPAAEARLASLPYRFALGGVASLQYDSDWASTGGAVTTRSAFTQNYNIGIIGPILDPRLAYFSAFGSFTSSSGTFVPYNSTSFGIRLNLLNRITSLKNPKYLFLLYMPRPISIHYTRSVLDGSFKATITNYGLSTSYHIPYYIQFFSGGKFISLKSSYEVMARLKQVKQLKARGEEEEEDEDSGSNENTNSGGSRDNEEKSNSGNSKDNDKDDDNSGKRKKRKQAPENSGAESRTDAPTYLRWLVKNDLNDSAQGQRYIPFPILNFDINRVSYTSNLSTADTTYFDVRARVSTTDYSYVADYSSSVTSSTDVGNENSDRTLTVDAINYLRYFTMMSNFRYDVMNKATTVAASSSASRGVQISQNTSCRLSLNGNYGSTSSQESYTLAANSLCNNNYHSQSIPGLTASSIAEANVNFAESNASGPNAPNPAVGASVGNSVLAGFNNAQTSPYSLSLSENVSYNGVKGFPMNWNSYISFSDVGVPYGTLFRISTAKWQGLSFTGAYSIEKLNGGAIIQGFGLGTSGVLRLTSYASANAQLSHNVTTAEGTSNTTDRLDAGLNSSYGMHSGYLHFYVARSKGVVANSIVSDQSGFSLFYNARLMRNTNLSVKWTYDKDSYLDTSITDFDAHLSWAYGRVVVDAEYEAIKTGVPPTLEHKIILKVSRSFGKTL